MYAKPPSVTELSSFGFTADDYADDIVEVWPDNVAALDLFTQMGTQWRIGVGGATGLDYGVLLQLMQRMRLSRTDFDQLFDDVRLMEATALEVMREKD